MRRKELSLCFRSPISSAARPSVRPSVRPPARPPAARFVVTYVLDFAGQKNYNFGFMTTFWDHVFGTYRDFKGPADKPVKGWDWFWRSKMATERRLGARAGLVGLKFGAKASNSNGIKNGKAH